MIKSRVWVALVLLVLVYIGCFGLLFENKLIGGESSFLFQVVVAIMSTGLLAMVTGIMFVFQSAIEGRKENRAKVFEKKIDFYNQAIEKLDEIFMNGVDDKTSHQLLFITSRAMLIASPEAADSFSKLYLSFTKQTDIAENFKSFIIAARKDLDLLDSISDGTSNHFDPILTRLESNIAQETKNIRYWPDDKKIEIIKEYDTLVSDKGKWLKEKHGLYYSQIATWRKQLADRLM